MKIYYFRQSFIFEILFKLFSPSSSFNPDVYESTGLWTISWFYTYPPTDMTVLVDNFSYMCNLPLSGIKCWYGKKWNLTLKLVDFIWNSPNSETDMSCLKFISDENKCNASSSCLQFLKWTFEFTGPNQILAFIFI